MSKPVEKGYVEYAFLKLGNAVGFCAELETWKKIANVFEKESVDAKTILIIGYKTRFGSIHQVSFSATIKLGCLNCENGHASTYTVMNPNMTGTTQRHLDELRDYILKHYNRVSVWEINLQEDQSNWSRL